MGSEGKNEVERTGWPEEITKNKYKLFVVPILDRRVFSSQGKVREFHPKYWKSGNFNTAKLEKMREKFVSPNKWKP